MEVDHDKHESIRRHLLYTISMQKKMVEASQLVDLSVLLLKITGGFLIVVISVFHEKFEYAGSFEFRTMFSTVIFSLITLSVVFWVMYKVKEKKVYASSKLHTSSLKNAIPELSYTHLNEARLILIMNDKTNVDLYLDVSEKPLKY